MSRIITNHIRPPIADFRFDWCAYHEEDVEKSWRYGYGTTEAKAIADLQRLDEEYFEYFEGLEESLEEKRLSATRF